MSTTVIRDVEASDLAAIMQIYHEAVHGLTAEHYDDGQRRAWAPESLRTDEGHWRNRLGGLQVLIGTRAGAPAGFCAFTLSGHVDLLFTHPAHARCGVARGLLEEAEARMRSAGTIQARTGASRLSRPLFEKLGYLAVGEDFSDIRGARLPHTNMRKFL
ncbi:MAG: GNAT family N-acetyltransferase [Planctomycetota bacterium]